jgi:GlpG protein
MRLAAAFDQEKQAYQFSSFLKKKGIENHSEAYTDPKSGALEFQIWVVDEDQLPVAFEWLERYRQNPDDELFTHIETAPFLSQGAKEELKVHIQLRPSGLRSGFTLTIFFIIICSFLFIWDSGQEEAMIKEKSKLAVELMLTPIEQALFFDNPKAYEELRTLLSDCNWEPYKDITDIQKLPSDFQAIFAKADTIPYWRGLVDLIVNWNAESWHYLKSVPLFEKIRQGEIWRLFTPCLLHRDFFHILFNMAWVWVLGRQIEERLKKGKMLLMVLIIGILSNLVQYLMGGPFFLGFSGIVVGMVGFIWMRQQRAPWEGYPLHRTVIFFIFIFVVAMFALEVLSWLLQAFKITKQSPNIANTAHIVGGLTGIALGKLRFFSKGARNERP